MRFGWVESYQSRRTNLRCYLLLSPCFERVQSPSVRSTQSKIGYPSIYLGDPFYQDFGSLFQVVRDTLTHEDVSRYNCEESGGPERSREVSVFETSKLRTSFSTTEENRVGWGPFVLNSLQKTFRNPL